VPHLTWLSLAGRFDESHFGAWSMPFGERVATSDAAAC
jgi:hypothetical protein